MPVTNMLDIAKLTGNDRVIGLIEENIVATPELAAFAARTIAGTSYKAGKRTAYPTGSFRDAGGGSPLTKSTFTQELFQCYDYGLPLKISRSVARAHEDGAEAFLSVEASGAGMGAMQDMGRQIFYGRASSTGGAVKGFQGLKEHTVFGAATTNGDALTVDAGGTTADTASSVYAVKFGPQAAQLIFGRDAVLDMPAFTEQLATDDDGNSFMAFVSELQAWSGLAVHSENAVRRIANLTADSGKGLTDSLLADLLATFPIGFVPDAIFMSRRSRTQLQKSRTVTLQGQGRNRADQPNIAPIPTEYDGVPILATDSILNTDALES